NKLATASKVPTPRLSLTATLPTEITGRLLADVDAIASRMMRHIAEGVSLRDERFRRPGYLRTVNVACRDAFRTLVRLLHDGRGRRGGALALPRYAGSERGGGRATQLGSRQVEYDAVR